MIRPLLVKSRGRFSLNTGIFGVLLVGLMLKGEAIWAM